MNYDKTSKLKIDDETTILVKGKNDYMYNISVVVNNKNMFANQKQLQSLIEQCNDETVNGFFYVDDNRLVFRLLVKEKCNALLLQKNINSALASVMSFMKMLEVINNE